MAKNEAKIKFTAETQEFNKSISKANNEMSELRAELKLNETQMKATGATVDGLKQKQRILEDQLAASKDKTEALTQKVNKAVEIYGENSAEVSKLKTQLLKAQTAEEQIKQAISKCNNELDEQSRAFKDSGKAADDAGEGFTVLKGTFADLASSAIQGAISKITEFTDYLMALPSQTMELRQNLATLTTSFDRMGFSTSQAKDTWKKLYAVFGDDGRAVEASNHISKMADNQKDLNKWVDITTGVYATYQDSLPVEGLAEAANETAKCGQVTGNLADALNWNSEAAKMFSKYMSEDVTTAEEAFNVALSECSTEQERQALITDTLTKLYGGAAKTYRDTASAQMEAKEATAAYMLAENNLATVMEPVTTAFTNLKTELLVALTPAIQTLTDKMTVALQWLKEHPTVLKAVSAAVAVLAVGISALAIGLGVYTVAQWAANSALLAAALPIAGVIAALAALAAIVVVVVSKWDVIKAKTKEVWANIKSAVTKAVNSVKDKVSSVFNSIKSKTVSVWNGIKNAILKPIETAKSKISSIISAIKKMFSGLKLKMPDIKLPHFGISPKGWKIGDLLKGSIPKLKISWYADGGIMTKPTIFGMSGNTIHAGGEAGPEAILPIDRLEGYIQGAIEKTVQTADLSSLAASIEALASRPIEMNINGRNVATATAGDTDSVNGLRSSFKSRGLILE